MDKNSIYQDLDRSLNSFFHFEIASIDVISQTKNQNIWYGHQINNTIVYSFCGTLPFFVFQNSSTHSTLRLNWQCTEKQYYQYDRYFIHF